MERRAPTISSIAEFVVRQRGKIAGAVGGGGLITSAFTSGRVDTIVGVIGGAATAYVAYRIIRRPEDNQNEPKDK